MVYLFFDFIVLHLDDFFADRLDYLRLYRRWDMHFNWLTRFNWLNLNNFRDLSYYQRSLIFCRAWYFLFYFLPLCCWFIFLCACWLASRFCRFHRCFAFRAFFLCWLCWFCFFLGLWFLACRLGSFGGRFLIFTLWWWIVCFLRSSLLFRRSLFFRLRLAFRFDWFDWFFIFIIFLLFTLISFFIILA